jgi:DNA-binding GntR family transcriptional regulator
LKAIKALAVREQSVDAIRASIMSGELAPGQRLVERELCETLDISRNTLRESYRQLEAEGFLEIRPHKGPIVATMSDDQARQIYEAREALECYAVKRFTERAGSDALIELRVVAEELANAVSSGNAHDVDYWKTRFYEDLFDGAENEFLHDQARLMYSRLTRLRARSLSYPGRAAQSAGEIRGVMAAIERRDAHHAADLWCDHVRHAAAAALSSPAEPIADADKPAGATL